MVIAVILVVLGYLGNIVGIWQSIKKPNVIILIAVLILLGAAGIIWIAIDASNATEQLKAKSEEIAKLNRDLLAKGDETKDTYKKLALSMSSLLRRVRNC